jgi:peptide/nickel transport system ATP-binding protein
MNILEVRDLSVNYIVEGDVSLHAVEGVNFSLKQGCSLGLVGESGCGKTTIMLSLLRLLPEAGRIVRGQILYEGRDLLQISEREMQSIRWREISMVFQGAMNALNPVRTIESQLVEALQVHNIISSRSEARKRAGDLLELVGISAERGKQYPHQFSGGMRQRAMIAMALTCNPHILIADEPTTALDVMIQAQIIELLDELQRELNLSLIIVTHDLGLVAETCGDVLVMYGGTLAEFANSDIAEPGSELASIPGNPPRLDDLPPGCRFEPRCQVGNGKQLCLSQLPPLIEIEPEHYAACHYIQR